jgi:hypothetical protein
VLHNSSHIPKKGLTGPPLTRPARDGNKPCAALPERNRSKRSQFLLLQRTMIAEISGALPVCRP